MKLSTKILLAISAAGSYFMSYLLDPQHLAAVQQLLSGHARVLAIFAFAIQVYNILHQPKQ